MKPMELARLLSRSAVTIRQWSIAFAPFLSDTGRGDGAGKHRHFTRQDTQVLATVARLSDSGLTWDEIRAALANMAAADWQGLADAPMPPSGFEAVPVVPEAAARAAVSAADKTIERMERRIEALESELKEVRAAAAANAERLLREVADARAALAETKALLSLYESGRLK